MTAEAPSAPPTMPRPQCPRCGTVVPLVGPGVQVIRCAGCGAALQVSARPLEQPRAPSVPPISGEPVARPRRRPMVELSTPRQRPAEPESPPITFTVELSQTDIETGELDGSSMPPPPTPGPVPAVAPAAAPLIDTPWYAEDIERLPEASMSLSQLVLEDLASLPPLPLRPDIPPGSRTGTAPARPPGVPPSHLQGK